ncbi:adrenocortical dysplasia protein homolog isoform X1 [Tamandua tetradactyla]|uniref:adrenocortical dysplasia protein homolog isoform X1 n=1 Tax=Tamandua tetradactyla TaxID=48850 RepID=UPI0040547BA9
MAGSGSLVLRPWIRELVLGSESPAGPQVGQLLEVLQEAETSGPSRAPDAFDVGAALLVSDGIHSVRCLLTQEALNTLDWEEKEFGFRGTEGRLLLLQDCGVRVQVPEGGAPAEFYIQVDRFSLLPTEKPRIRVAGCNEDPDVQKKLYDCLEEHLSESTSPSEGLSLSQLLDEVQEDKEHRGALVRLVESCLMLTGPCTAAPLTRWATSRCSATEEAVYTIPSLWLHISEDDQQILNSLGPGTPAVSSHMESEESGVSISLLSVPGPLQQGTSQSLPAICSAPGPPSPSSPHPSQAPSSPLLSHTPSLLSFGHVPSPHQAHKNRAQKPCLEFKEVGLQPQNQQPPPRTRTTRGALEPSPIWDPPKRHRDGSAFQYAYEPPCTSLCSQVQAVRLPPQLVAWALHILMEPQPESELPVVMGHRGTYTHKSVSMDA